jgi:poly-gamma-glutamate capsule biosynthesis protein CapA/YwtB (metallophosphatase superfamily)
MNFNLVKLRCVMTSVLISALLAFPLGAAGANNVVSLVFAGDSTLDADAGDLIARGGDPFADFASFFVSADIRITNLECVVATKGSAADKMYTFRAHPRVIPVLKKHFDAVTLANNHSGDFGPDAFVEMLKLLKEGGLDQVGGGINLKQAHAPLIFERKGLRIAVLSYNEFQPRSFEASHNVAGVAWSEDQQVVADIAAARSVHKADLVIPIMHWGWENELRGNPRQWQLAKLMIDAGADAIIGGHPHVTQDVGVYKGKPIFFSVGNFVMKETDNDNQRKAWVLKLKMDKQGVKSFFGQPIVIDMKGIPKIARKAIGPCWQRGAKAVGQCRI